MELQVAVNYGLEVMAQLTDAVASDTRWLRFESSHCEYSLKIYILRDQTIAQWIDLRLPFCSPGFDPQALNLRIFNLYFNFDEEKTKINKKRPELTHLKTLIFC